MQLTAPPRCQGFALLDAALALALLSGGALALLWLGQQHLLSQRQQLARETALVLAQDLVERIHLNATQVQAYAQSWSARVANAPDCQRSACNRSELALWDVQQWRQRVSTELPQGDASVFAASSPEGWWGVVLAWHDDGESLRTDPRGGTPERPATHSCWRLWFRP